MRVKLKQDARALKKKALASMRAAMAAFNSPDDDGRVTSVLLHLQHSFEMLLKASLVQGGTGVFDKKTGRSIGFEQAVRQCQQLTGLKITDEQAGTLRAVDAMRDDEQHWLTEVDEGLLYLHARASVTLFDDVLRNVFGERLADHLPLRVLPISVDPPQEIRDAGRRGVRQRRRAPQARPPGQDHRPGPDQVAAGDGGARRAGRAGQRHRREQGREGHPRREGPRAGLPRLGRIGAAVAGQGLDVQVRFVKHDGVPVRLVKDDAVDAAAVREVDLSKKYHRSPHDLARAVGITTSRATALRAHLGIDGDDDCRHVFVFGAQRHTRYSDNALTRMRDAVQALDMDGIWAAHTPNRTSRPRPRCAQAGCAACAEQEHAS